MKGHMYIIMKKNSPLPFFSQQANLTYLCQTFEHTPGLFLSSQEILKLSSFLFYFIFLSLGLIGKAVSNFSFPAVPKHLVRPSRLHIITATRANDELQLKNASLPALKEFFSLSLSLSLSLVPSIICLIIYLYPFKMITSSIRDKFSIIP